MTSDTRDAPEDIGVGRAAENDPDRNGEAGRNALVVVAHHRTDSLTTYTARRAAEQLQEAGYHVDELNLYSEGFDPRMTVEDEPDWDNREKTYSVEVESHMKRLLKADLVVAVFPIWWVHIPAILKGWIDRVWNYGLAYGRSQPRLAGKRMLWLALSSATDDFALDFIRSALDVSLNQGVAYYSGFDFSTVGLLPDSEEHRHRFTKDGTMYIDAASIGAERDEQYRQFHQRAKTTVDEFITATAPEAVSAQFRAGGRP
ncbi:NAD(P)H oxidoreductase [Nocardia sp. NPDC050408]|uniref:NAD(P)H oxidoreductase n=1 Tax=Nocardia sp. NPDC050408 TaxID=3364319 RepID=UPI0037B287C3